MVCVAQRCTAETEIWNETNNTAYEKLNSMNGENTGTHTQSLTVKMNLGIRSIQKKNEWKRNRTLKTQIEKKIGGKRVKGSWKWKRL